MLKEKGKLQVVYRHPEIEAHDEIPVSIKLQKLCLELSEIARLIENKIGIEPSSAATSAKNNG